MELSQIGFGPGGGCGHTESPQDTPMFYTDGDHPYEKGVSGTGTDGKDKGLPVDLSEQQPFLSFFSIDRRMYPLYGAGGERKARRACKDVRGVPREV